MARRQSLTFKFILALVVGIAALLLTSMWWLPAMGSALVRNDPPEKADIAVTLGGDTWGMRILTAADLERQGYVPTVLVSGPPGFYDQHECEPAIAFAARRGYPAQYFIPFPHEARSTAEEAAVILPELRRRGVHRMLLVTSDYHSRRAFETFRAAARKIGYDVDIRMIAAPDKEFHPTSWWRTRQGQKIEFMEWTKTVAAAVGL